MAVPLNIILLADDPLISYSLEQMVSTDPRFSLSGIYPLTGFVEADNSHSGVDVILADLGWNGLTLRDALIGLPSNFQILILYPTGISISDPLLAHFNGAVSRTSPANKILAALDAVAQGLNVRDSTSDGSLLPVEEIQTPAQPVEPLTPRENEVLAFLMEGLPNKMIARKLGISEHTAKFHVTSILAKMGAQSRTEAVIKAARLGLIRM